MYLEGTRRQASSLTSGLMDMQTYHVQVYACLRSPISLQHTRARPAVTCIDCLHASSFCSASVFSAIAISRPIKIYTPLDKTHQSTRAALTEPEPLCSANAQHDDKAHSCRHEAAAWPSHHGPEHGQEVPRAIFMPFSCRSSRNARRASSGITRLNGGKGRRRNRERRTADLSIL